MNKRDLLLNLINDPSPSGYIPAAFFLHFDQAYHLGQAAIDRHLAYFRATGMDFVKIQYEQPMPGEPPVRTAEDWLRAPRWTEADFEPTLRIARGLVEAAKGEALVIMTLYSPFMWAAHLASQADLALHLVENPEKVQAWLEILTENVITLARGCIQAGVDGFYASSQGGEAFRFPGTDYFERYVKPSDLAVWEAIRGCPFNILHICDYVGGYADLTPFLDYPGQVVNCNLKLGDRKMTPREVSEMFARPYMGGMERLGVIAHGSLEEIRREAEMVLAQAPERFILGADCTVPSETPWENLHAAIEVAHGYTLSPSGSRADRGQNKTTAP